MYIYIPIHIGEYGLVCDGGFNRRVLCSRGTLGNVRWSGDTVGDTVAGVQCTFTYIPVPLLWEGEDK